MFSIRKHQDGASNLSWSNGCVETKDCFAAEKRAECEVTLNSCDQKMQLQLWLTVSSTKYTLYSYACENESLPLPSPTPNTILYEFDGFCFPLKAIMHYSKSISNVDR